MKKEQLIIVSQALDCLKGENLRYVMRAGSMGDLGFGNDVDKTVNRRNEQNLLVPTVARVPKFALHIDGRFRITCGDEIILAKNDMFHPSSKIESKPDFDWDAWATNEIDSWDVRGNNRYDEICSHYFSGELFQFTIKKVIVSKWGDLRLEFENDFILETFVDVSKDEECWRFFVANDLSSHIVITRQGLEEYESELEY